MLLLLSMLLWKDIDRTHLKKEMKGIFSSVTRTRTNGFIYLNDTFNGIRPILSIEMITKPLLKSKFRE